MSKWLKVRSHYLFRVALGYLTLVWLLALAIGVVFPMFGWSTGSTTLAISLLILGFPIVMFLAWTFGEDGSESGAGFTGQWRLRSLLGRRVERAIIVVLVLAVGTIGIHQFVIEERTADTPELFQQDAMSDGATSAVNPLQTINIGILSPQEGSRTQFTGFAHEASIQLAFERLSPILADGINIDINLIPYNDEGSEERAAFLALQLANEEGVAAILGPVNSASTSRVLSVFRSENIDIPVISSLSTARELIESGSRDQNFYRLIFDDSRRMRDLGRYLEANKSDEKLLLLYDDDTYGRGLATYLAPSLPTLEFETAAWCELLESSCLPAQCEDVAECANTALPASVYQSIERAEVFDEAWAQRIRDFDFSNVVLLGTVPGALAFAQGLDQLNSGLEYTFVGSNDELFEKAPVGSIIIGNPVLDPRRAPSAELMSEWEQILSEFEERFGQDQRNFVISAYEAAMVLHSALRFVLTSRQEVPPLEELRRELLVTLDRQDFDSVEPWRRIKFIEGDLGEPQTAPIYVISQDPSRVEPPEVRPWVDIDVDPRLSYMEGPIHVQLRGHSVESARVLLWRVQDGNPEFVRDRDVVFSANDATVDFNVFRTGSYRISIDGVAHTPTVAQIEVELAWTYAVSVITAFLGALVVILREPATFSARAVRVLLGMFAGFALTFSALYGAEVSGWFPFPKFGDEPYVNAIVTGLIGGLVGPYVLVEVFLSWALTLSLGHGKDSIVKEIPEGL